jgi:arylsulfatase A-like enzyme
MTDFAPTLLELAGTTSRVEHSGESFVPFLRGETPSNWRDAWFTQFNGVELYYSQRSVTTRRHKYVYNGFDFDELYDLKDDPHMLRNLAFPDWEQERTPHGAQGLVGGEGLPWPPLSPELEDVRRDLLRRMWAFAREQQDIIFNSYLTVAMAPIGPGLAI